MSISEGNHAKIFSSKYFKKVFQDPLHSQIPSQVWLMGAENTEVLPYFVLKYNGDDLLLDEVLTLHISFQLGPFKSVYLDFLFLVHHSPSFWSLPTYELSNSNAVPMPWADGHTYTETEALQKDSLRNSARNSQVKYNTW